MDSVTTIAAAHILGKIFSNPQPVLYHYTTKQGLLGILTSKKIWLTDTRFLNDPDEQKHGLMNSREVIKKQVSSYSLKNSGDSANFNVTALQKIMKILDKAIDTEKSNAVYCISFSEDGDLLSQWKGYSEYGDGFSIGFETKKLNDIAPFFIGRVIYEDKKKEELIKNFFLAFHEYYKEHPGEDSINFESSLISLASFYMKSKFFSEEKEWRLLVGPDLGGKAYQAKQRCGPIGITPYIELDLGNINDCITDIVTGPKVDFKINRMSLSSYINSSKIRPSSNSLRG